MLKDIYFPLVSFRSVFTYGETTLLGFEAVNQKGEVVIKNGLAEVVNP